MTPREIDLQEKRDYALIPIILEPVFPMHADVVPPVDTTPADVPEVATKLAPTDVPNEENQQPQEVINEPNNEPLRRSQRVRRSAIPSDYVT